MSVDQRNQDTVSQPIIANDSHAHEMKRGRAMTRMALLSIVIGALIWAPLARTTQTWQQIPLHNFCVTEGAITESSPGNLVIEQPRTRAVLNLTTPETAELSFRYLAPTT